MYSDDCLSAKLPSASCRFMEAEVYMKVALRLAEFSPDMFMEHKVRMQDAYGLAKERCSASVQGKAMLA